MSTNLLLISVGVHIVFAEPVADRCGLQFAGRLYGCRRGSVYDYAAAALRVVRVMGARKNCPACHQISLVVLYGSNI